MSDVPNKKVSHPLKSPPNLRFRRPKVKFLPLSVMVHTRIWWRRSIQFSHTAMSAVSNQGIGTMKPPKDSAGFWLTIIACKSSRMWKNDISEPTPSI